MKVSFNGYGENVATFECAEGVSKGKLVKISDNGKVSACSSGDKFCGVAIDIRNGFASVQLSGYTTVKINGSVSCGYQNLVAHASDTVKVQNEMLTAASDGGAVTVTTQAGREILVVDVDTTANTAGIIL